MLSRSLFFSQTRSFIVSCTRPNPYSTVDISGLQSTFFSRRFTSSSSPSTSMTNSPIFKRINNITKSHVDKREYRGLILSNQLKVLLVSDSEADKSAAAIAVEVGHLNDPWEVPGVAHFCEHMLFLGTEKYPEENEYSKYVQTHAGSSNAYTSSDLTNYHFDVKTDALEGALDRFVQFFLSPQFTESATEKEVNAVDSEHANNKKMDAWRNMQLDRSLARPGHVYGKFGTGNKQTLMVDAKEKGLEPREVLLEFHKKYYSSNIMSLAIAGKESLDELEEMVCKLGFADIENKNVVPNVYDAAYGPEECGRYVQVVPIKDTRSLSISFPMPDLSDEYRSHSVGYLSHLIGHEGPGCVLSHLKKKGWVSNLSAGYQTIAKGFGVFKITSDLTMEGLEHVDDIIAEIYHTVAVIRAAGPQKWIFDEVKQLKSIEFMFKDKIGPLKLTTDAASNLHTIPLEDILCSDYIYETYNPDRIMNLMEYLRPSNMWYRVVSKKFESIPDLSTESIYGTQYKLNKIDKSTQSRFESALSTTQPYLYLPQPNQYIATKFDLKPCSSVVKSEPSLVRDDRWSRVWFKQDQEFHRPKQVIKMTISSPMIGQDPKSLAIGALAISCLDDKNTEAVYDAELAGLGQIIDVTPCGIDIKVRGFDEKLSLFLHDVIDRMIKFKPDADRFVVLKEKFIRSLQNFSKSQPYQLSQHLQSVLLTERTWSKEQILACAKDITIEEVASSIPTILSAFHVEMLIHGNTTEEEALTLATNVVEQLRSVNPKCRSLFGNEVPLRREHDLGIGNSFVYRHAQNTHEVSSVEILLQTGPRTLKENCLLTLLCQIISEPSFNILRTNEQLGYIVAAFPSRSSSAQSLCIIVQGPKDPDYVDDRIESFLNEHVTPMIRDITDESFNENVTAVIHQLEEKPKTLGARFNRFWTQVDNRLYDFNKLEREVEEMKKLTKADLYEFYQRKIAIDGSERRKLSIFVHPSKDTVDEVKEMKNGIRKKREAGDASEEIKTNKIEMKYPDMIIDRLGYFGRPIPSIDLPPIGTPSNECSNDNDNECKSNL